MQSPGLFDIQVNGFAGVDFNSAALTPDALDHALEAMLATGVTACLPTVITALPHELEARFAALDEAIAKSRLGPLMCPGTHLEGPFLNPAPGYAGCHPPEAMSAADAALIARLQARLRTPILMVTVAPEIEGGLAFVRAMAQAHIVVAIGHSALDFACAAAAADAGARLSTHLGNGSAQQVHKLNNAIFAQLADDRLCASFIADGLHVHPKALKVMIRARGLAQSILVSDAVAAAAAPPGLYELAGMKIEHGTDGAVRLPGTPTLAGSALCLDQGVRNIVKWGIASDEEALAMASLNPAACLFPAFSARNIGLPVSTVEWTVDLAVKKVRLGTIEFVP